jgi:hypothetical protein
MSTEEQLTPEEIEAQAKWEAPRRKAREDRQAWLSVQRHYMVEQLTILTNSVTTAFQHGDHTILTAAEEECLRLLDIIRSTRGRR